MKRILTCILILVIAAAATPFRSAAGQTSATAAAPKGFWSGLARLFLPHREDRRILYRKHTLYFMITVEEDHRGMRHLVFNPNRGSQGIWNPEEPEEIVSEYSRHAVSLLQLSPPPGRVLFIGMGAGIMPRFVRKYAPEAIIDIVEIDGEIPGIARDFFGFEADEKMNIIIGDGRNFVNNTANRYDFIFIDAYNAEYIPFHLTTIEFYRGIRAALAPGGRMTANIANTGKTSFVAACLKTVAEVFPRPAVISCGNRSNYIVLAPAPEPFPENTETTRPMLSLNELRGKLIGIEKFNAMTTRAIILTDNFAPVETMK